MFITEAVRRPAYTPLTLTIPPYANSLPTASIFSFFAWGMHWPQEPTQAEEQDKTSDKYGELTISGATLNHWLEQLAGINFQCVLYFLPEFSTGIEPWFPTAVIIFFFFLMNFYWGIVALQCCYFLQHSKVNQLYVYIYPPLFKLSFPFRSPQSTE